MNLKKIKNTNDNKCDYFYKEVHEYLIKKSKKVKKLSTFFERNFEKDLYFNFFGNDISYEALDDKKNIKNFEYKNIFKEMSNQDKSIYKNRISFFEVNK